MKGITRYADVHVPMTRRSPGGHRYFRAPFLVFKASSCATRSEPSTTELVQEWFQPLR